MPDRTQSRPESVPREPLNAGEAAEMRESGLVCGLRAFWDGYQDPDGCGEPIITVAEVYRCTDCRVPFHVGCANRHFAQSRPESVGPEPLSADERSALAALVTGGDPDYGRLRTLFDDAAAYPDIRVAIKAALRATNHQPVALDVPPLPEKWCGCSACRYLRRKQAEHAPPNEPTLREAAQRYNDAEWALRFLDEQGIDRLDPRWNAAVDEWRVAEPALRAALAAADKPPTDHEPVYYAGSTTPGCCERHAADKDSQPAKYCGHSWETDSPICPECGADWTEYLSGGPRRIKDSQPARDEVQHFQRIRQAYNQPWPGNERCNCGKSWPCPDAAAPPAPLERPE